MVATASYEARRFGIHSGMPLRTAARRCPDAVFLASDPPAYEAGVRAGHGDAAHAAGAWSRCSAGTRRSSGAHTGDPEALAGDVQRAVKNATGLACSVGIGDNRLRAKLATGFAKPAGDVPPHPGQLGRVSWPNGPPTRCGASAARPRGSWPTPASPPSGSWPGPIRLCWRRRFGPTMGPWYRMLALGVSGNEVTADPYVPKSRSRETTFQQNIADRAELDRQVVVLARRVAQDVGDEGRPAVRVAVKVRFAPFFTQTRSVTLESPTSDADEIERAALAVLDLFRLDRPVRLLGVRAEFLPSA